MQIAIELDLPAIISQAVSAERIQPIVDKAITSAIESAIRDATGYGSGFSKAIKEQMNAAMPHGLHVTDVAKFQHMVNSAVIEAVQGANAATIQAAIRAGINEALPEVPARIKLTELLNHAREGFHKEGHESFYARLKPSEYSGGGHLYLDEDGDKRYPHAASIQVDFDKDGEVYALKFDGRQINAKSTPTVISRFEGLLMAMYTGRTTLEVDIDPDDVESAAGEQWD
ncbi:hypothetical protein [Comamonas antarctica]|uniref:hypothetical protein n=1 Tax=Comamonas antarctica TaxID=2743470 RepID=UPI0028E6F391|nr:hypothetical protein [Comamonas antarctica]